MSLSVTEQFVLDFDQKEAEEIGELFLKSTDARPGKKYIDFVPKPPAIAFSKWTLEKFKARRAEIWRKAYLKWGERLYEVQEEKHKAKRKRRVFVRLEREKNPISEKTAEARVSPRKNAQKKEKPKRKKWKEESHNSYGFAKIFKRAEGKRAVRVSYKIQPKQVSLKQKVCKQ